MLLLKFINIVFILFYKFIELIILLYTFLVIYFAQYREYMISQISFSKFSDVFSAFTYARAIDELWTSCLGVNILSCLRTETLDTRATWAKSNGCPFVCVCFLFETFCFQKDEKNFCFYLIRFSEFWKLSASFSCFYFYLWFRRFLEWSI